MKTTILAHCDAVGWEPSTASQADSGVAEGGGALVVTTLWEKLIKIGAKAVRHGRYVTFQLAEVTVPRNLFWEILWRVDELQRRPAPA